MFSVESQKCTSVCVRVYVLVILKMQRRKEHIYNIYYNIIYIIYMLIILTFNSPFLLVNVEVLLFH